MTTRLNPWSSDQEARKQKSADTDRFNQANQSLLKVQIESQHRQKQKHSQ